MEELTLQVRRLTDTVQADRATTLSALKEYQAKEASQAAKLEQCETEVGGRGGACALLRAAHGTRLHTAGSQARGSCRALVGVCAVAGCGGLWRQVAPLAARRWCG